MRTPWFGLIWFLIGASFVTGAAAEEVVPGSVQDNQAQKFLVALEATPTPCSAALVASENTFFCATTPRDTKTFRAAIDRQTEALKPVGPWAAYTGEDGQQRSFVYKDGFMTVSYFPSSSAPKQNSWIVQYIMPED